MSWRRRRRGCEEGEITDSGEQITGTRLRHSFDCAVLFLGDEERGGLNAEGTEKREGKQRGARWFRRVVVGMIGCHGPSAPWPARRGRRGRKGRPLRSG